MSPSLIDPFGRSIDYVRVSVTDRCDLRCSYCLPKDAHGFETPANWLSFDEISRLMAAFVDLGTRRIRLTGGEPLLRKNIEELIAQLAQLRTVDGEAPDLTLTTNGILLPKFAIPLKEAGLDRVNISIDSMNSNRYREITRGGELKEVLAGVDAALEAGLTPIKINCVVNDTFPQSDADDVKRYAEEKGIKALLRPLYE
jgi:cyclic pyranopterin phosphate synthase